MNEEYKTFEELKEELGDKFEEYMYKANINLLNNWNELKEYCLNEQIPEEYDEYNSYIEFSNSVYENVLNKMQELEQGKDD